MPLLLLGIIAVGAGLLLVYYSLSDKQPKKVGRSEEPEEKGKVIYMFNGKDGENKKNESEPEAKQTSDPPAKDDNDNGNEKDKPQEEPTKKDD